MPAESEEIQRLYGALKERALAKDAGGAIQIYEELIRLGRPLSEIMALGAGAPDGRANVRGSAGVAPGGDAGPDKPPASDTVLADAMSKNGADDLEIPADLANTTDVPGDASTRTTDADNVFAPPDRINTSDGELDSRPVAMPRWWSSARLGLSAVALAALAGVGILLMLPTPSKTPVGLMSGTPGGVGADPSPSTAATPQGASATASVPIAGGVSSTEPESRPVPVPAATTVMVPSAEPVPPPQPQAEVPERGGLAAVVPSLLTAAPTEPRPAAIPPSTSHSSEAAPPATVPASIPPPDRPHLTAVDTAMLVARGDSFLSVGDITSARLFYERAGDAGDGRAALRLGATYDPGLLDQVHLPNVHGDAAQALSWYRRAHDLGEIEAERLIQRLATQTGR
jgi:hypothetical protein